LKAFKEFSHTNLGLSDEDCQGIHISQLDITVNIGGTLCSFSYALDYNLLKERLAILFEDKKIEEYFGFKDLSLSNGDNCMSTCV